MQNSGFKEMFLWLIRLRRRYRVTGASMFPLLKAGDEVLVDLRAYGAASPTPGDIVVARHPFHDGVQIIKRVAAVGENGRFHLKGDNPDPAASSDSTVPHTHILGRVTSRFG